MNTKSKSISALFAAVGLLSIFAVAHAQEEHSVSAADALAKLKEGNERYANSENSSSKPTTARRAELTHVPHGQAPFAIVVGCADSRTSPEIIFDQNLGDLFVVRTAGNLAGEHALGSIEYAVANLGTRLVVVLGHERCGAVKAAIKSETADGHVGSLVREIQPAVKDIRGRAIADATVAEDTTIAENARLVAAKIRSEASLGAFAEEVQIVSAVYDLDTGKVAWPSVSVADLKKEGGQLVYNGVWDWDPKGVSGLKLDPAKEAFEYIYAAQSYPLPNTLKDNADGNAVLEFTLPDGNYGEFEWISPDEVKGRFWLKPAAKTEKPATQIMMKR